VSSERTAVLKDEGIRNQNNSHSSPREEKVMGSKEEVLPFEENLLFVRRFLQSQLVELKQSFM